MKPKVSIIMPVLNGERYIREALDSILAQTYRSYQLVVVDDGSTDRTRELVEQYNGRIDIRYVRHEVRQGIAVSVNHGIRHSTGDFISFLDHDDLWFPQFLETLAGYLEARPEVGMVHSDFQTFDPQGRVLEASVAICRDRRRPSGEVFRELFLDSFIVANGALIRKECFDRLGGFDETLRWGDYHMWMRIARHYRIDYLPKVLAKYRQHPGQSTRSYEAGEPEQESVALAAIQKILDLYPELRQELGRKLIRRRIASLYFDMAYAWLWSGARRNARMCLARAIRYRPFRLSHYLLYAAALLRPSHARAVRQAWHALNAYLPAARRRAALLQREVGAR